MIVACSPLTLFNTIRDESNKNFQPAASTITYTIQWLLEEKPYNNFNNNIYIC